MSKDSKSTKKVQAVGSVTTSLLFLDDLTAIPPLGIFDEVKSDIFVLLLLTVLSAYFPPTDHIWIDVMRSRGACSKRVKPP